MTIYFDNFANEILQWCTTAAGRFKMFWPLKGGWEAWVQAEVAAYLLHQNSAYDVLREQPIYQNGRQSVDWLLNDSSMSVVNKIAIELKCQSLGNSQAFIQGVQHDIVKLNIGNLKPEYQNCQRGMMVIYFDSQARDWVLQNNFVEIFNNNEVGCAMRRL